MNGVDVSLCFSKYTITMSTYFRIVFCNGTNTINYGIDIDPNNHNKMGYHKNTVYPFKNPVALEFNMVRILIG